MRTHTCLWLFGTHPPQTVQTRQFELIYVRNGHLSDFIENER